MLEYTVLFVSTLLDHVGVPVPLIATIVLLRNKKTQITVSLLVVLCALILSDLVTFYFGRYFNKIISKKKESLLARVNPQYTFEKVLRTISQTILKPGLWIILFNKFIPVIGKYMPLAIGYNGYPFQKYLILFILANTIYALFYVTAAYYFGEAIKNGQTWLSVALFVLFLSIYILTYIISKKRKECHSDIK